MALIDALTLARGERLALGYGGTPVLSGLDFAIRSDQCWALLGRNGSGKTTFVRALTGELRPMAGTLDIVACASGGGLGIVPQRCDTPPELPTTVREFVALGLVGAWCSRAEGRTRLAAVLARLGIADLARRDLRELSGGQRQRALLARALVRQPTLLVLDEPTAALDQGAEDAFLALLGELRVRDGSTMVVVTHDRAVARRLATHVALFAGGCARFGTVDELLPGGGDEP